MNIHGSFFLYSNFNNYETQEWRQIYYTITGWTQRDCQILTYKPLIIENSKEKIWR